MDDSNGTAQVEAFIRARAQRPRWTGVPRDLRPETAAEGYQLQRRIHHRLDRMGQQRVGYKIGCTAPSSREPFGL